MTQAKYLRALFLFASFRLFNLDAQPVIHWQHSYGGSDFDDASVTIKANDGGYIVAGYSASVDGDVTNNHGSYDAWVVKTDSSGILQWQKSYGGSDYDQFFSALQTSDGYFFAGATGSNDGDVTNLHGGYDCWIVKTDPDGTIQWQKTFGGSDNENAYSIIPTYDGNYMIAASSASHDGDVGGNYGYYYDFWIFKIDPSGNLLWEKNYGGSNNDGGRMIVETPDSGYVITGNVSSNDFDVTGNHGSFDNWLLKIDSAGNLLWQKTFGGSESEIPFALCKVSDGFVLAGYTHSSDGDVTGYHGGYDYWVMKADASGNLIWEKALGGSGSEVAYSVAPTDDGGVVVAGYASSNDNGDVTGLHGLFPDYWIVKLDSSGNMQWQKCLGGFEADYAESIIQISTGKYLVAGWIQSNNGDVTLNNGIEDYWVVELEDSSYATSLSEDILSDEVFVFPNPFDQIISLQADHLISCELSLTVRNALGQIFYSEHEKVNQNCLSQTFDLNLLTNGIYFLEVVIDGKRVVKKLVKQ